MYTFAASLSGRQYGINVQSHGLARACLNLPINLSSPKQLSDMSSTQQQQTWILVRVNKYTHNCVLFCQDWSWKTLLIIAEKNIGFHSAAHPSSETFSGFPPRPWQFHCAGFTKILTGLLSKSPSLPSPQFTSVHSSSSANIKTRQFASPHNAWWHYPQQPGLPESLRQCDTLITKFQSSGGSDCGSIWPIPGRCGHCPRLPFR